MQTTDIKIGQRVRVLPNNMIALIVGRPEYYSPKAKLVRIKYENSTRYEYTINRNIELLPIEDQYPAHGGCHKRQNEEL